MATNKRVLQLTPEQIALSEERRAKKLKNQGNQEFQPPKPAAKIIERPWIALPASNNSDQIAKKRIRIMTWNVLAQSLIRRELFPTSGNCLRVSEREPMLFFELFRHSPDVICLQEVDRIDQLSPVLRKAGYSHHFAAGPGKKHGCVIAFKSALFTLAHTELVQYDNEEVRDEGNENARRGRSFQTRNIANIVALKSATCEGEGVVAATTHLFWHPKYVYERARQAGILLRATNTFRETHEVSHWPAIIAGDFNFAPNDPAYALLTNDPVLPDQSASIVASQVVHLSVDPTIPATAMFSPATSNPSNAKDNENEEEGAADPDCVITKARLALPSDGLLSPSELHQLFTTASASFPPPRSAYDMATRTYRSLNQPSTTTTTPPLFPTFGERASLGDPTRLGWHEPDYTSYTHYWKTVLDYIFVLDPKPPGPQSQVSGFLTPHRVADLVPGLPQKGVCASDHVSLVAELVWS